MSVPKCMLSILCLFAVVQAGICQDDRPQEVENVSKVTFLSPGLSYEQKLGRKNTVVGQFYMNPYAEFSYSSSLGTNSAFYLEPSFSVQLRHYYNYAKRQNKGQRTEMNSMNYLSLVYEAVLTERRISSSYFVEEKIRPINTVGAAWGLQRNFEKRFSLDLSAGLGYLFTKGTKPDDNGFIVTENIGRFTTMWHFTLGFWLNRKNDQRSQ